MELGSHEYKLIGEFLERNQDELEEFCEHHEVPPAEASEIIKTVMLETDE